MFSWDDKSEAAKALKAYQKEHGVTDSALDIWVTEDRGERRMTITAQWGGKALPVQLRYDGKNEAGSYEDIAVGDEVAVQVCLITNLQPHEVRKFTFALFVTDKAPKVTMNTADELADIVLWRKRPHTNRPLESDWCEVGYISFAHQPMLKRLF